MVPLIGVVPAPKETLIRLSISTESSIHVVDKGSQTTNETIVTINENSPHSATCTKEHKHTDRH